MTFCNLQVILRLTQESFLRGFEKADFTSSKEKLAHTFSKDLGIGKLKLPSRE